MPRVLIARSRTPLQLARGGDLEEVLRTELKSRGIEVDIIELPKGVGGDPVSQELLIWSSLDLASVGGIPVDLVIATSPLALFVNHPKKIAWLKEFYRIPVELASELRGVIAQRSTSADVASAVFDNWGIRSEVQEPLPIGDPRWGEVVEQLLALSN